MLLCINVQLDNVLENELKNYEKDIIEKKIHCHSLKKLLIPKGQLSIWKTIETLWIFQPFF
jgi:hypothetical protein